VWKLKGVRNARSGADVSYVWGKQSGSHLLLKCPETERWREELPNSKWRHVNEEILRKIVTAKKCH
jgi:hypothetical protein